MEETKQKYRERGAHEIRWVNRGSGFVRQRVYKSCRKLAPMVVYVREGDSMGINRWQGGIEDRKRNEKEAKAGEIEEEISEEKKGDSSSRLEASEEPENNPEKRRVIEKLREREQDS